MFEAQIRGFSDLLTQDSDVEVREPGPCSDYRCSGETWAQVGHIAGPIGGASDA